MASFSDILDSLDETPGTVELSDDWRQGRAIFGGLVTALAVRALRRQLVVEAPLRSLLVQFAGPVEPGACFFEPRSVRAGRSTTHGSVHVSQGAAPGDVRCVVLASFGARRTSSLRVDHPGPPEVPEPDRAPELPYLDAITPVFTKHLVYRWAVGAFPFTAAPQGELGGFCRFREPQRASAEEVAIALSDAWPPPILPLLSKPAPASSMTWAVDFADLSGRPPGAEDWYVLRARATAARDGYAHVEQVLWDPCGAAIAVGTQSVAVFDAARSKE
jgi:acyl-CoA thioesterase